MYYLDNLILTIDNQVELINDEIKKNWDIYGWVWGRGETEFKHFFIKSLTTIWIYHINPVLGTLTKFPFKQYQPHLISPELQILLLIDL